MVDRFKISRIGQTRFQPSRNNLTNNNSQTYQQRIKEDFTFTNKINESVLNFINSYSNLNTLKTESKNYYNNNINNIPLKQRSKFSNILSNAISKVEQTQNYNLNRIQSQINSWKNKIRQIENKTGISKDRKSVSLQNYETKVNEANKLYNQIQNNGDLISADKVLNYANELGNQAGSNLNKTIKGINYSKEQQKKQQEALKEAQKRTEAGQFFQKTVLATIPKTSELGIEASKQGGYSDILRKQSISEQEAYKRTLEQQRLLNLEKSKALFPSKQQFQAQQLKDYKESMKDYVPEKSNIEKIKESIKNRKLDFSKLTISDIKNINESTRILSQSLEGSKIKEEPYMINQLMIWKRNLPTQETINKYTNYYNNSWKPKFNETLNLAIEEDSYLAKQINEAQSKVNFYLNFESIKKAKSLSEINKISNPLIRSLKKLELGIKVNRAELKLGVIAGIINFGQNWYNLWYLAKNIDKLNPIEIGKGTIDYVKKIVYDVSTRPVYGLTRLGTEAILDYGAGKLIDIAVKKIKKPVKTKYEVERATGYVLIGDNQNIKLTAKTYKEITDKIPKVQNELYGRLKGKLFYTAEGYLKATYNIYSTSGRRLTGQKILQIGTSKIDDVMKKSDDVLIKNLNEIIKTRNIDFISTAKINLKTGTLEILKTKVTQLSQKEWKSIQNILNQKIALRYKGTKEATFGYKTKEIKRKIMNQADTDRLKTIFDNAMNGKKPDMSDIKFIQKKDIKIRFSQDKYGKLIIEIGDDFIPIFNQLELKKVSPSARIVPYKKTEIVLSQTTKNKLSKIKYIDDINRVIIPDSEELLIKIRKKYNIIEAKRLNNKEISLKLSGKLPKSDTTIFAQFKPKNMKLKKVYETILNENDNIKKISFKRKNLREEAIQVKQILNKAKKSVLLPKQEARLLLENQNFKVKITKLSDGTILVEIPDIYTSYSKKMNDILPTKYKRTINIPEPKKEIFREVVNPDGTVLLQKLKEPELKLNAELKQKVQSLRLVNQKTRTQYKAKLEQKAIPKYKYTTEYILKLKDPIITYKILSETKSKLNNLGIKFVTISKLLSQSRSKLSQTPYKTSFSGLQYQKQQIKQEQARLQKTQQILRSKLQDQVVSLSKLTDKKSQTALISLKVLLPKQSSAYKFVTDQILKQETKLKEPLVKYKIDYRKKIEPKQKIRLSWYQKPKDKRLTYLCNGLIKSKGKIRELNIKMPVYRALKYMINLVDNTTSRSFALKIIGVTKEKDIKKPNLYKFRMKISNDPKVLMIVEKSKYAIDSTGEKRGLKIGKYLKKRK